MLLSYCNSGYSGQNSKYVHFLLAIALVLMCAVIFISRGCQTFPFEALCEREKVRQRDKEQCILTREIY